MNNNQQIHISLENTTEIVCEQCGCKEFVHAFRVRKQSGILTGSGTPTIIPIPVLGCIKCGHVNKEFLPKEIQKLD